MPLSRIRKRTIGLVALAASVGFGSLLFGTQVNAGVVAPPLDHFLCYTASATSFQVPPDVVLQNQFVTAGFHPKIGPVKFHCNPTEKQLATGQIFPIQNRDAHLVCFKIMAKQPSKTVVVTNQFGQARLTTGNPNLLCLPSWKSLTGPPNQPVNQPPGLDHFTCYPVKYVPGTPPFTPPTGIKVRDQFSPAAGVNVKVAKPKLLCLPTQKTTHGTVTPINNPQGHLLCFGVTKTPIITPVFDQNQFGTSQVAIKKTSMLCLPSTKDVVGP